MAAQKSNCKLILSLMFGRRWWLATLLILIASGVCIRLGFWQLDRLKQERSFTDHVGSVQAMPPLNLPAQVDLTTMEYRAVTASGKYDFQNQIATRDQYNGVQPGYDLFTPLQLSDGEAVLVDRGWIPSDGNSTPTDWRKYDQPGQLAIKGTIRLGQAQPTPGSDTDPTLAPNQTRLDFWIYVNMDRIRQQIPYPILPVYVELNPNPAITDPPIPIQQETLDLSSGANNLNYAIQWFSFSILFIVGYGYFLWRKELRKRS
ncbi:MAG: SURF1 family protein [Anaerolineales bacterium]